MSSSFCRHLPTFGLFLAAIGFLAMPCAATNWPTAILKQPQ